VTLPRIERKTGVALWRQIEQVLTSEIEAGTLEAGSRLPTEPALAERFGVNRHTVRRAVSSLVDRGLVKVDKAGAVLSPSMFWTISLVREPGSVTSFTSRIATPAALCYSPVARWPIR
jgi:DNA-binding GntR family transcriptional regulator